MLEAFWNRAAISKLEAKFAVAKEMAALPHLPIQALRSIVFQYRYFTQSFVTDLALLVARSPEGPLRSLLGQLVNEELGNGDPEQAHMRLYDRFLASIGAIEPGATASQLPGRIHPQVRGLIDELHHRTTARSLLYAIGMRGVGGECVCGVYFSVMHGHLRQHPFIIEHDAAVDWAFWDIHAGHADVEHNQLVRAAVAEFVAHHDEPQSVAELSDGFDYGTAIWDAFWSSLYAEHCQPKD
jgi:pyrroloquinoline quinone (PQQ) biosynthesis protein C